MPSDKAETSVAHSYEIRVIKKRLPTTSDMVDDALVNLQAKMGVSLKKITSYITGKYVISMSGRRNALIKQRLKHLMETKYVVNVTGVGLKGKIRIVSIAKFRKLIETQNSKEVKANRNSTVREDTKSEGMEADGTPSLEPQRTPPTRKRFSVFDTPPTVALSQINGHHNIGDDIRDSYSTPVRSTTPPKKKRSLTKIFNMQ
ncbi:uncharacterized protein LOC105261691 [Musca domestica]|uniref:Uncharacterized protein LOC105261691 n=1 Tax=Musca domestica TaxID=7370 RepID=A0A9J7D4H8_MUSDO|nr:uncharacterized protein LOC105261691 [Musca domestica]